MLLWLLYSWNEINPHFSVSDRSQYCKKYVVCSNTLMWQSVTTFFPVTNFNQNCRLEKLWNIFSNRFGEPLLCHVFISTIKGSWSPYIFRATFYRAQWSFFIAITKSSSLNSNSYLLLRQKQFVRNP